MLCISTRVVPTFRRCEKTGKPASNDPPITPKQVSYASPTTSPEEQSKSLSTAFRWLAGDGGSCSGRLANLTNAQPRTYKLRPKTRREPLLFIAGGTTPSCPPAVSARDTTRRMPKHSRRRSLHLRMFPEDETTSLRSTWLGGKGCRLCVDWALANDARRNRLDTDNNERKQQRIHDLRVAKPSWICSA